MAVSVVGTVQDIESIIPDGEQFKVDLKSWREGVFLELPEANGHLWRQAAKIFEMHMPENKESWTDWQRTAVQKFIDGQHAYMRELTTAISEALKS